MEKSGIRREGGRRGGEREEERGARCEGRGAKGERKEEWLMEGGIGNLLRNFHLNNARIFFRFRHQKDSIPLLVNAFYKFFLFFRAFERRGSVFCKKKKKNDRLWREKKNPDEELLLRAQRSFEKRCFHRKSGKLIITAECFISL